MRVTRGAATVRATSGVTDWWYVVMPGVMVWTGATAGTLYRSPGWIQSERVSRADGRTPADSSGAPYKPPTMLALAAATTANRIIRLFMVREGIVSDGICDWVSSRATFIREADDVCKRAFLVLHVLLDKDSSLLCLLIRGHRLRTQRVTGDVSLVTRKSA